MTALDEWPLLILQDEPGVFETAASRAPNFRHAQPGQLLAQRLLRAFDQATCPGIGFEGFEQERRANRTTFNPAGSVSKE